ncbi:MAG TPA: S8 family serine peptidase, partial [Clostridia bacterium]|nr:S8 family serine peptidase [Clostridia bacterium]
MGLEQDSDQGDSKLLSATRTTKAYLVQFKADASKDLIHQALEGETYRLIGHSDRRLVSMVTEDLEAFKARAAHLLTRVEEDAIRTIQRTVNDPYASQQWALDTLNLYPAWDITTGSRSVFVAILDTGVSRSHPDLLQADIREGWDYLASGGGIVWDDPEGHGTAVTGVIAATANNGIGIAGLAWKSAIIPFKVLDKEGKGSTSDSTQAIYDAADAGCKVINISFGCQQAVKAEEDAIQYALDKGAIVVAAAGNDENSEYNYPASYPRVISVAAIDREKKRAYFSNYNDRVSLTAPGQEIMTLQLGGNYVNTHGTS